MADSKRRLELREAVIVEGRYDRIKLSELISSPVIETGGFRVFKDKERQTLIRKIAERRGILIMTDVDSAGFVIRNFLRGIIPPEKIKHAYIPTVKGKEKRKSEPSKEGVLGVEGIEREALIEAIRNSGAHIISGAYDLSRSGEASSPAAGDVVGIIAEPSVGITKQDFYGYGLSGGENSAKYREQVLCSLGLPKYLSANAMVSAVNCLFTKKEFEEYLSQADFEL